MLASTSASSRRPLRSSNRFDLLVPPTRTVMAQYRSFTSIGPSLWNTLSPSTRSQLLTGNPPPHFLSSNPISSLVTLPTGSASERFTLVEALYKCFYTIQYNTIQYNVYVRHRALLIMTVVRNGCLEKPFNLYQVLL